ncbi:unnamed protein product [Pylaiella littoralis]
MAQPSRPQRSVKPSQKAQEAGLVIPRSPPRVQTKKDHPPGRCAMQLQEGDSSQRHGSALPKTALGGCRGCSE